MIDLDKLKELFKKADMPKDIRVEEDYLDYGYAAVVRPSSTALHSVFLSKANSLDVTTDAARFICHVSNIMPEIIEELELLRTMDEACKSE